MLPSALYVPLRYSEQEANQPQLFLESIGHDAARARQYCHLGRYLSPAGSPHFIHRQHDLFWSGADHLATFYTA